MNIIDYFNDWGNITAEIYNISVTYDINTGHTTTSFIDSGNSINGVKYNRSAAERFYSERFQPDVTEAFVTEYTDIINEQDRLVIDSVTYSVESVVNVAEQNEVLVLGLKEFT